MRRIILAAFAVVLLHAAPSMAAECTNLALPANGGEASASSEQNSARTASALNNGIRENENGSYHWFDRTGGVWPDWAQIEWRSAQSIDRIVLQGSIFYGNGYEGIPYRTQNRLRVQYWDGSGWVDVSSDVDGQDNPILDWTSPWNIADGSEIKRFDLRTAISTTKIRVLFEASEWWSTLDEIEAYGSGADCEEPPPVSCENRVVVDGSVSASSTHSSGLYPLSGLTDGYLSSGATQGYWNDDTNGVWPDWVQSAWARPIAIDRIVARIPLAQTGFPVGEITLRRTRIQYWDAATSAWVDVVGRTGQDNPIVDWQGPLTADGSETKTFDFAPVTTTKVRVLFEDGSSDGWSWLDELEVYSPACTPETPRDENLSLDGSASASSTFGPNSARFINDGARQTDDSTNYWADFTPNFWYDWAQVEFRSPRQLNRIVVRAPYRQMQYWYEYRQLAITRVQWWDASVPRWRDVDSTQDNPVLDWIVPEVRADGSEIRQFDFPAVSTRRVRVLFERGNRQGGAFLDELETYWIS